MKALLYVVAFAVIIFLQPVLPVAAQSVAPTSSVPPTIPAPSATLKPWPPESTGLRYPCTGAEMKERFARAKEAVDAADWSMVEVIKGYGEDMGVCSDVTGNPSFLLAKAHFFNMTAKCYLGDSNYTESLHFLILANFALAELVVTTCQMASESRLIL